MPSPSSVAEVVAQMEGIAGPLPRSDGVACFTRLYLAVTRGVDQQLAAVTFADAGFLTRLDVAFAATNTVRVIVALLAGEVKDTVGKVACARATLRPQKAAETAKKHNVLKKVWRKGCSHERYYCGLVILDKITDDVNGKPVDITS